MRHASTRANLVLNLKLWLVGLVAICAVAVTVPLVTASSPSGAGTSVLLGSYNGGGNVSGNQAFASETGTTASNYSDYLDGTSFSSMCSGSSPYPLGNIVGQLGSAQLILSVPLAGARYGTNGAATMASYVANPAAWDQCFTTLATDLVADGFGNAIIRLMWEPDSGIYSSGDLTSAANYATLWRDAWTSAMAVSGAHFQWAWYWGGNFDSATNDTAYPGGQYVDYITFDQYDQSWQGAPCSVPYNGSTWTATQSNCVWTNNISQVLGELANFASNAGKPIGIGEWGVINRGDGHGGGDDPTFINNFTTWMNSHNVAWASYFNFNSGGDSVLAHFPNSLTAFKSDLGGSVPPTTTTTTTVPVATTTTVPPSTTTTTAVNPPPTTTTTTPPHGVTITCSGVQVTGAKNFTLKCRDQ